MKAPNLDNERGAALEAWLIYKKQTPHSEHDHTGLDPNTLSINIDDFLSILAKHGKKYRRVDLQKLIKKSDAYIGNGWVKSSITQQNVYCYQFMID